MNLFPHAINPLDCLTGHGEDSLIPSIMLASTAIVNSIMYLLILWRWSHIVPRSRIQTALKWIFFLCAVTGYMTFAAGFIWTSDAYTLRLYAQIGLIGACGLFLWDTRRTRLEFVPETEEHSKALQDILTNADIERRVKISQTLRQQADELRRLVEE